jgi:hypothetical protein
MKLFQRRTPPTSDSIQLGQHMIPRHKLFEHVMVSGNPGSGKSTLIRQIARQAQAQGWPVIIIDIDGESTQSSTTKAEVIFCSIPWIAGARGGPRGPRLGPVTSKWTRRRWPHQSFAGGLARMTLNGTSKTTLGRLCAPCFKSSKTGTT